MTGACPALYGAAAGASGASIAGALRAVDCLSGQATAAGFARLFGPDGRLLPALTLLLTLYVGLFAMRLLTGRGGIGLSSLTPRMLTLGLALTFATSWAAYSQVVWTLAAGAPDQLASMVAGTHGSATAAFADRLDGLFTAVGDAADAAGRPAPATATGITPATPMVGGFTAATVLWLSALMLLLGTVGVLIVAKVALAALLALGPVFIVLALFPGTRGLFEGWLKGVVLFALVPLFAVLIGGATVAALAPVVRALSLDGGQPSPRAAGTLFVGAAVYLALMVIAARMAGTLVAGWRVSGGGTERPAGAPATAAPVGGGGGQTLFASAVAPASLPADARIRDVVAALPASTADVAGDPRLRFAGRATGAATVVAIADGVAVPTRRDARATGLGTRFRPPPLRPTREHIA